ncbi:CRISPR-associated protein Csx15 [Candidatus Chlorohelix sp.]|uniref:CRISPR-associated protein Csx15 n=1 Tax=Candidatus Chlorohelix sp. TaxID=3139201 RepID=UPI00303808AC
MLLINFSHPISASQKEQIEKVIGQEIESMLAVPVHLDLEKPMAAQVDVVLENLGISLQSLQQQSVLIILPGFSPLAAYLLTVFHGILGYFPSIAILKPDLDSVITDFKLAEILNLQALRNNARSKRF